MAERFDRRRAAVATAVFLAVLLLGALAQFAPRLTQRGDVVSSTPIRKDQLFIWPVVIEPGGRACIDQVPLDPGVRIAQLLLAPSRAGAAGSRLTLEASGSGYRTSARTTIARGLRGEFEVPFAPPRRSLLGTLCVRNHGPRKLVLGGTSDARALTRSVMTVDGARQPVAFSLTLREAGDRSLLSRVPQLVERTAALSAAGPWLLWLLLPLLLLGVPAGVLAALRLALRDPEPSPRPIDSASPQP